MTSCSCFFLVRGRSSSRLVRSISLAGIKLTRTHRRLTFIKYCRGAVTYQDHPTRRVPAHQGVIERLSTLQRNGTECVVQKGHGREMRNVMA